MELEPTCYDCSSSAAMVKWGKKPNGVQRYKCKACNLVQVLDPKQSPLNTNGIIAIEKLLSEGVGPSEIARKERVARSTVYRIKKKMGVKK